MAAFRRGLSALLACAVVAAGATLVGQQQPNQPAPAASGQQQAAEPPQQPTFRGGINFVRVDVTASARDGTIIADLKAEDFEVTEDGKPQKIETFKFVELDGGLMQNPNGPPPRQIRTDADEEVEAARDDVRLFAFFLDDYHVRRESSLASRQEISRFIETQLGPTDMVAIMYPLQPIASMRFTRNHDAIRRAIDQFVGRKFEYEPKNEYEQKLVYYPTETVEKVRNQISLSAMESLVSHMGGLKEGRKTMVLVSEGYSNMLPPQMRNPSRRFPASATPRTTIRTRAATTRTSSGRRCCRQLRHAGGPPADLPGRQPQQRLDLRRRPARPCHDRVQHRREHQFADRSRATSTRRWIRCG